MNYAQRQHNESMKIALDNIFHSYSFNYNIEYFNGNYKDTPCLGEIDALSYHNETLILIEYKVRYNHNSKQKAIKQLKKHLKYSVPTNQEVKLYFVWGKNNYKQIIP